MDSIENSVSNAILLKPEENVLIICDKPRERIAKMFSEVCEKLGAEVSLVRMNVREETKREPPKPIVAAMKHSDLVLGITTRSLTHTEAVRMAKKTGARVATMPGITDEVFPALGVNYKKMAKFCKKVAKFYKKVREIKVEARLGTNLILGCRGREVQIDDGILNHRGSLHNLPAGEVGVAPLENSANGRVIFDICAVGVEKIKVPIEIWVRKGKIIKISGKSEAKKFKHIIEKSDKNAKTLCEFSIGTNSSARLIGRVLNDEKALGTCHVAFGDNLSIGGKNRSKTHLDGVIKSPTIWFDNKLIMKNGRFVD